jgi:lipid-A-disaccharide synthase
MKIFFSVGEPSGDLHGANLIRQLRAGRPDVQCVGYGGPRMAAAGCQLHADLTELADMWFLRVVLNLHRFWGLYVAAKRYLREQRPDAVVLIDYPGFNWWIARAAKHAGIPVFYYGVPQLWAWAAWRVRKMRRFVDHVLCKLPFEADWYRQRNCHATYVGHPYFDQLTTERLDQDFVRQMRRTPGGTEAAGGPIVAILPGSRTQEVEYNLHWFLKAAAQVRRQVPEVRFTIAAYNDRLAAKAREQVARGDVPADVFVGRTPELIHVSHCCLACSGSVSLELLHHARPTVILYWIKRFPYTVARNLFMKVRFITLVNLLAAERPLLGRGEKYDPDKASSDSVLFPEYLTYQDRSQQMAAQIVHWLTDPDAYQRRVGQLRALKDRYGAPGASRRGAEYILSHLPQVQTPVPRPHFAAAAVRKSV